MKIRMKLPNDVAPTEAAGPAAAGPINDAAGPVPPLVVAADFTTAEPFAPASRRAIANAAHASGPAAEVSPLAPTPNHDARVDPSPETAPAAAGAGAADITGTDAAAAGALNDSPRCAGAGADTAAAAGAGATPRPPPPAAGTTPTTGAGDVTAGEDDEPVPVAADGATAAAGKDRTPECGAATAVSALAPGTMSAEPRTPPDAGADALADGVVLDPPRPPDDDGPAGGAVRVPPRVVGPAELFALEPDDPAEPVVSANATAGIAATAAPTPNATANAPTRPTYRE